MIIDEIRRLRATGLSQHEIAAELNKRKMRTPRGKAWTSHTVGYLMRNTKTGSTKKDPNGEDKLKLETIGAVLTMKLKPAGKMLLIKKILGES